MVENLGGPKWATGIPGISRQCPLPERLYCWMSSAPGSGRKRPGTTHGVFSRTRRCNPAPEKLAKPLNSLSSRAGAYVVCWLLHRWKEWFHQEFAGLLAVLLKYEADFIEKSADRAITFPFWGISSFWALKSAKRAKIGLDSCSSADFFSEIRTT